jgi:hypothetical protein
MVIIFGDVMYRSAALFLHKTFSNPPVRDILVNIEILKQQGTPEEALFELWG